MSGSGLEKNAMLLTRTSTCRFSFWASHFSFSFTWRAKDQASWLPSKSLKEKLGLNQDNQNFRRLFPKGILEFKLFFHALRLWDPTNSMPGVTLWRTIHALYHPIQGGVKKFLVASYHKTGEKCWCNGPLYSNADFTFKATKESIVFLYEGSFQHFSKSYTLKDKYYHCLTSDATIIWYQKNAKSLLNKLWSPSFYNRLP